MFEALKKKFSSWLGKAEEEKEEKKKKPKKPAPAKKPKKEKKIIIKKKAKTRGGEIPELIEEEIEIEPELKEALEKKEKAEEEKEDGGGFFSRLFKRKEEKKDKIEDFEEIKEDIEEEKEEGFFSKIIRKLSTSTIKQEEFDSLFSEFEITLLENNVALEVVDKIRKTLSEDLVNLEVKKSEDAKKLVMNSLKNSILSVLIEAPDLIEEIKKKTLSPYIILFFGINGSGKTTTIAKLAHLLKKNKISCIMAAADTFRAASIEQLQTHGLNLGIEVIAHNYGSDPASVAFDAIKHAKSHNIQVVLIDTAGRMYTKTNLLKEMEKIVRVSKPDLKIFVGESITGNDATEQAKTFNETAGIDGIILSKADVDEKAGAILSVSYVTSKPIYFLGTGQDYEDLAIFKKKDVLKHLGLE